MNGKIRAELKYYNWIMISAQAPTEGKDVVPKQNCYTSLEKVCDAVPNYDIKQY